MQIVTDTLIPNDILFWRRRRSLNQRQFALALGLSRYRISCWEQGRTLPSWENLNRIADLFGCNISQLYRNTKIYELLFWAEPETKEASK